MISTKQQLSSILAENFSEKQQLDESIMAAVQTLLLYQPIQQGQLNAEQAELTPLYPTPDQRKFSQPGSLGLSLFTYQVEDIIDFHQRVSRSSATNVTSIVANEFGEPSFGLVAPDRFYWIIIGKSNKIAR